MKNALVYLTLSRLKNKILSMLKKPAYIIYAIVIIALLAVTIIGGNAGPEDMEAAVRDPAELRAIAVAFFSVMFLFIAKNGFGDGGSIFQLADVNLIFTSPLSTRGVLFYGLFQQLGTSLLLGLFLLFQYSWMHALYGISYPQLLLFVIGYALSVFSAQIAALVIYSFCSGRDRLKRILKYSYYALYAAFAATVFIYGAVDRENFLPRAVAALDGILGCCIPVGGMIGAFTGGLITGKAMSTILGGVLTLLFLGGLAALILKSDPDYYEDVLQSSEKAYETKAAAKQGVVSENSSGKIKTGKTGLGRGEGASVFYYKHLLENRRSRTFILQGSSLVFVVMTIGFAFIMRGEGVIPVLVFSAYTQFFTVAMGRLVKEMTKPFVYLVPEPPFQKLLWSTRESLAGFAAEAVLIFVPCAFILSLSAVETAACILLRISFSYLFLAGNIAGERVFGSLSIKGLVFFFYFITLILLSVPGIIAAVVFSVLELSVVSMVFTCCIAMTVCNVLPALLVFFLCHNILQYAELNN